MSGEYNPNHSAAGAARSNHRPQATMPKITLDIPHSLGRDGAVRRLQGKIAALLAAYQSHLSEVCEEWHDGKLTFSGRALGMKIAGTLAVDDDRVHLSADLPLAAALMKGKIEGQVREQIGKMLT
ncbi:MAG: polyhydroxyalkanoic acid system family protein [Thermoguttaceae bacterium]